MPIGTQRRYPVRAIGYLAVIAAMGLVEILRSRFARLWIVGLIVFGALAFVLIRVNSNNGDLSIGYQWTRTR